MCQQISPSVEAVFKSLSTRSVQEKDKNTNGSMLTVAIWKTSISVLAKMLKRHFGDLH